MSRADRKFATDMADGIYATSQMLDQLEAKRCFKLLKALLVLMRRHDGMRLLFQCAFRGAQLPDLLFGDLRNHLYQLSLKALTQGIYGELSLSEFGDHIAKNGTAGVFILGSRMMGWFETFKQRHHHIAEFLRDNGFVVVCAMNPSHPDDVTRGVRQFSENMFLVNFEIAEIREQILRTIAENAAGKVFFHLVGTEPGTTIADLEWMQQLGITLYYEYFDEISKEIFPGLTQMQIDRHQYMLSNPNILVCTTAQKLYDNVIALRKCRDNLFLSRNAVTLEDWDYDEKRDGVPPEMEQIIAYGKPIIGFYGSFAPWLDYVSIRTLAEQRPDYHIVMIGYDYEWGKGAFAKSGISSLPNVHIMPAQKYKDLKRFSHWFDIGILPFRIYGLTETVSPVKIFEYMAQGLPVVAAALPECKLYKSVLTFTTPVEFVAQIDKALELKEDSAYLKQLAADAAANTWKCRGEQVLSKINNAAASRSRIADLPTLSVGIPLYNMERLLPRCLDSLLMPGVLAGRNRVEVIVVNDGSKDCSLEIAKQYQQRFPSVVTVIDKENGGHGSCINAAVAAARGRYFKLIDSDDYVNSSELIRHLNFLDEHDVDVAVCDYRQVYEGGSEKVISYWGRLPQGVSSFESVLQGLTAQYDFLSFIHMHAITYRTSLLKNIRITEKSFFVDQEYITYPLTGCKMLAYQPICVYQYQLGRPGQSVDPAVIKRRIGQNLAVLRNIFSFYEKVAERGSRFLVHYLQGVLYNQTWFYLANTDNEEGYMLVLNWWRKHAKDFRHDYNRIIRFDFGESIQDRERIRTVKSAVKKTPLAGPMKKIKRLLCH